MRHWSVALIALACAFLAGNVSAQVAACPEGGLPRSDFGIRYRFTAGDFIRQQGEANWVHFFTEPVIAEVERDGPADGTLRVGDVIVAVEGLLITTREGSRRFVAASSDRRIELSIRRNGAPLRVRIRPLLVCVPPG